MQRQVPIRSLTVALGLALITAAVPAWATNSCRDEVKQNYKDCKAGSKETYQASKDACLNRDHTCVEACRADRYDCRQATGFDAAIKDCNDTLAGAKTTCRNTYPAGSDGRDGCIDQAQLIAFQCRDQAREDAKPALKQCRANFVACAQACPPAASGPPPDPVQCKLDAKTTYKTDLAACLEDLQVQKDACRNKDHTCVEQCRADRETCRQPVESQLESDIGHCNEKKCVAGSNQDAVCTADSECPSSICQKPAVTNCQNLYGPNGTNPDPGLYNQCIDNAQAAAFECRDQARENAQPGFQNCRQGFATCVGVCPPAS